MFCLKKKKVKFVNCILPSSFYLARSELIHRDVFTTAYKSQADTKRYIVLQCRKSKREVSKTRASSSAWQKANAESPRVFCRSREIVVRLSLNRMTQHKGIQRIIKALCIHFFFFFQSGTRRGQETCKDVQREEEARQVRRHAGRGSEQTRSTGPSHQQPWHYYSKSMYNYF